jgi:hypothetical protein
MLNQQKNMDNSGQTQADDATPGSSSLKSKLMGLLQQQSSALKP